MYGFELVCRDRTYELHAPNRKDLCHWLRLFKIIITMAEQGLKLGPVAFEAQQIEYHVTPAQQYVPEED